MSKEDTPYLKVSTFIINCTNLQKLRHQFCAKPILVDFFQVKVQRIEVLMVLNTSLSKFLFNDDTFLNQLANFFIKAFGKLYR